MKVYEVTFACPDAGFVRLYLRNKRQVDREIGAMKRNHPLRHHMKTEYIEVPDDKQGFVNWLNSKIS